jgi:Ankyrin repeat
VKLLVAAMEPTLINTQDNLGCTPLHCAVEEQRSAETVSLLIEHGADVHARCSIGQTPLFYSSEAAVTRLLLKTGAAVNLRDYLCNTVLHNAAALGLSAGVICCLLEAGANPYIPNSLCDSPAEVAEVHKHFAAAALLQRAEDDHAGTAKRRQRAPRSPALPAHLAIEPQRRIWRSSTDVPSRRAVLSGLAKMPVFDTEPDRVVLLQCLEFQLYSTATNLAEYKDMNTVQQRAVAVIDTVKTQIQRRTAAAAAALKSTAVKRDADLKSGSTSSTKAGAAQQHSDVCDAAQHLQGGSMSTSVADQQTVKPCTNAKLSDCIAASASSGDNDAVQTVEVEQQQQQQQHQQQEQQSVQLQQAATAAVTLEQSTAVMATVVLADSEQQQQQQQHQIYVSEVQLSDANNASELYCDGVCGSEQQVSSVGSDSFTAQLKQHRQACIAAEFTAHDPMQLITGAAGTSTSNQLEPAASATGRSVTDPPETGATVHHDAPQQSAISSHEVAHSVISSDDIAAVAPRSGVSSSERSCERRSDAVTAVHSDTSQSVADPTAAVVALATAEVESDAVSSSRSGHGSAHCSAEQQQRQQQQLLQNKQRSLAAEQRAEAAARAAAAASATAAAVLSNVALLRAQMHTRVLAAAVSAAATAAVRAAEALNAEAAALQALHAEQDMQYSVSTWQSAAAAAATADSNLTDSDDEDNDDCPLLMHAALLTNGSSSVLR